jgi:hypothetical protein
MRGFFSFRKKAVRSTGTVSNLARPGTAPHSKGMCMCSVPEHPSSVTNLAQIRDAVLAAGLSSGLLLLEHAALWRPPFRLSRPASYAVGSTTLGLAFSLWALRHHQAPAYQAMLAWWCIASSGGATVAGAYYVRHILGQIDQQALSAGLVAGGTGRRGNHQTTAAGH